jgi:hypothetical protein
MQHGSMIEQPRRCRRSHAGAAHACARAGIAQRRRSAMAATRDSIATRVCGIGVHRGSVRTDDDGFFAPPIRSPSTAWRFRVDFHSSLP